jgi:hypothetical protein
VATVLSEKICAELQVGLRSGNVALGIEGSVMTPRRILDTEAADDPLGYLPD